MNDGPFDFDWALSTEIYDSQGAEEDPHKEAELKLRHTEAGEAPFVVYRHESKCAKMHDSLYLKTCSTMNIFTPRWEAREKTHPFCRPPHQIHFQLLCNESFCRWTRVPRHSLTKNRFRYSRERALPRNNIIFSHPPYFEVQL